MYSENKNKDAKEERNKKGKCIFLISFVLIQNKLYFMKKKQEYKQIRILLLYINVE